MIKKIISGGQTGADKGSLEGARQKGVPTGGTCPAGWRTEIGPDLSLEGFGLICHASAAYPPRTRQNVKDADGTLWMGRVNSAGYRKTLRAAKDLHKPFKSVQRMVQTVGQLQEVADWAERHGIIILNCAGNRESTNPGIQASSRMFIAGLLVLDSAPKLLNPIEE